MSKILLTSYYKRYQRATTKLLIGYDKFTKGPLKSYQRVITRLLTYYYSYGTTGPRDHGLHGPTGARVHATTGPRAQEISRTVDSRPEIPVLGRSDIEDPCRHAVEGKRYTYRLKKVYIQACMITVYLHTCRTTDSPRNQRRASRSRA